MYQALFATSETIRKYITDHIAALATGFQVYLNTPQEIRVSKGQGISVWLYRVVRDAERLNDPPERLGWSQLRTPPLPLKLHYLITPVTGTELSPLGSPQDEQRLLG